MYGAANGIDDFTEKIVFANKTGCVAIGVCFFNEQVYAVSVFTKFSYIAVLVTELKAVFNGKYYIGIASVVSYR